jgi:hypothetical protein
MGTFDVKINSCLAIDCIEFGMAFVECVVYRRINLTLSRDRPIVRLSVELFDYNSSKGSSSFKVRELLNPPRFYL